VATPGKYQNAFEIIFVHFSYLYVAFELPVAQRSHRSSEATSFSRNVPLKRAGYVRSHSELDPATSLQSPRVSCKAQSLAHTYGFGNLALPERAVKLNMS
jgi:hypothetical protein